MEEWGLADHGPKRTAERDETEGKVKGCESQLNWWALLGRSHDRSSSKEVRRTRANLGESTIGQERPG